MQETRLAQNERETTTIHAHFIIVIECKQPALYPNRCQFKRNAFHTNKRAAPEGLRINRQSIDELIETPDQRNCDEFNSRLTLTVATQLSSKIQSNRDNILRKYKFTIAVDVERIESSEEEKKWDI